MSETAAAPKQYTGTGLLTLLLIVCGGGLLAAAGFYANHGDPFLERFDHSVGEMLMNKGRNAEAAGDATRAMGYYRLALDTRFEGAHNRASVQTRLGTLLLDEGDAEQARELLGAESLDSYHNAESYAAYCRASVELDDGAALATALEGLQAQLLLPADAAWFRGQAALLAGDEERAAVMFEEGVRLDPASPCAVALAKLEAPRRVPLLESYLLNGGTGETAVEARALLLEARQ